MTPDQIFARLAVAEGLPRDAMAAAGARRERWSRSFSTTSTACSARGSRRSARRIGPPSSSSTSCSASGATARAYRPLTGLLRHDPDFLELLLGDAVTEGTARVVAGVCDGDLQPIFEVIDDPAADEYIRCQMIDALVMIARDRPETRPDVTDYLERFYSADIEKPETLWGSWSFAVADLGLEHLEPQVRQAFEQEWVSPDEADFDFFHEQLRKAVEGGESPWFHRSRNSRLIESAIDDLSRWYCFSDEYLKARAKERASASSLSHLIGDTFGRDVPKVARNDPCPCGSGKKFKKCCLH